MNTLLLLALLVPPFVAAAAAAFPVRAVRFAAWLNAATMPISLAAAAVIAARLAAGAPAIVVGRL